MNRFISMAASCLLLLGGPRLFAAQQSTTWLGGAGNWTDATKWSGGVVPNNNATDTFSVNIDNGGTATTSIVTAGPTGRPTYTVDALTIDASDRLTLADASLNTGALTINGALWIQDSIYGMFVNLPADSTITGTGTVRFAEPNDGLAAQIRASAGTMTIGPGITVRGGGFFWYYYYGSGAKPVVGAAGTALINRGRILAEDDAMIVVAGNLDNQGTLEVANNGKLVLESDFSLNTIGNLVNNGGTVVIAGTLNNAGQTLTCTTPNQWMLNGTIKGGTVATTGNAPLIVPSAYTATLNNVTLNGDILLSSSSLNVVNGISGSGTILMQNATFLEGAGGNVSIGTIPAGITLRGGEGGENDPGVARITASNIQGRIRAEASRPNRPAHLRILSTASGTPVTNTGSLEVNDGATLHSLDSLTFGTGGKFVLDGGGLLDVTGNLNLSTTFDSLDVRPRLDGQPYASQLIATYTGSRTGTFNTITPGISVEYLLSTRQIRISGTPVPEPAGIRLSMTMLGGLACRRGRRRRLGGRG